MRILELNKNRENIGVTTYTSPNIHINCTYMNTTSKVANIPNWQNLLLENLPGEIWKPIPYCKDYLISNKGRIKYFGRIKKLHLSNKYPSCFLKINNESKSIRVHKIMELVFLNHTPETGLVINHLNGIRTDNREENLEVVTQKENVRHAIDTGLHKNDFWKGKINTPASKAIIAINKKTGEEKEYPSTREFCRQHKGYLYKSISEVLSGKRKGNKEYKFKFK